jgi:hypothetical protein
MLGCMRTESLIAVAALLGFLPCHAQTAKPGEVAPGVTLPTSGDATVLVLDTTAAGPALVHVKPHEVVTAPHAAVNWLRAQVLVGPHSTAEVEGQHADTIVASTKAVVYVRLSGEEAEIMRDRVHLLWLQLSKRRREISDFSMNVFGGQRSRNVDEVPCETEMVEGTNWLKVTPKEPLLPGEFAIAFLPKDVNQLPDAVYDFSVSGGKATPGNPYAPKQSAAPDAKNP